jgi:putative endopeptidase
MNTSRLSITAIAAAAFALAACNGSNNDSSVVSTRPSFDATEIDKSISACQDFNAYVNRKWTDAAQIPADASRLTTFSMLEKKSSEVQLEIAQKGGADVYSKLVQDFYRVAADEAASERAGGAPLAPQLAKIDAIRDTAGLSAYLNGPVGDGRAALFLMRPFAGDIDPTVNVLSVVAMALSLKSREPYLNADARPTRDAFVASVTRSFMLTGMSADAAGAAAQKVLAFETKLAEATPAASEDNPDDSGEISLARANQISPNFDWTAFFKAQGVTPPATIKLSSQKWFAAMDGMIKSVPLDDWKQALRYAVIRSASKYLSKAFRDEDFNFYGKTLEGLAAQPALSTRILDNINNTEVLGKAMGVPFQAKTLTPETVAATEAMVKDIRAAFRARLAKSVWLAPQSIQRALAKEEAVLFKIGGPKSGPDISGLKLPGTSWYDNATAVSKFDAHRSMLQVGTKVDRNIWYFSPQDVQGAYSPTENSIQLTAAILQPPFFDAKADLAMNYGALGAVIGHELTHGFDSEGSRHDATGALADWLQPNDHAEFDARVARLARQYDAYEALPGLHLNGKLTERETTADSGGVNTGRDALVARLAREPSADKAIDGFTQQQRYYLAWARIWRQKMTPEYVRSQVATDPHPIGRFRVIGPVSNMPEFAQAFSCKTGDPMVRTPEDRVTIW